MQGSQVLFIHRDEVEHSWRGIDSIQEAWEKSSEPPKKYSAGTWGPVASVACWLGMGGSGRSDRVA